MKKLGIVCLILLFAVGVVGPGYAWWSDTVTAKKHLESGAFELGIRVLDECEVAPSHNRKGGKNESEGCLQLMDGPYRFQLDGLDYAESVQASVYGTPSFSPCYTVEIANGGSIPARLDELYVQWDGEISHNIQVEKWSVTSPKGVKEKGRGLAALRDFTRGMIIDPEQKINIEMLLAFKQTGAAEGKIFAEGSLWNGTVWDEESKQKEGSK